LNLAPTASTTAQLAVGDALAVCLIQRKNFGETDFKRCHPGGALGQRLAMRVAEIMHTDNLPIAAPETPLSMALETMTAGRLGLVAIVAAEGRLAGILTDGDVRRILSRGLPDLARPVIDFATKNPKALPPERSAGEAMDLMETAQITVLPIVDAYGRLAGMVHLHDLLGKGRYKFAG
jgi:arabinose-5-phosphate isomerase